MPSVHSPMSWVRNWRGSGSSNRVLRRTPPDTKPVAKVYVAVRKANPACFTISAEAIAEFNKHAFNVDHMLPLRLFGGCDAVNDMGNHMNATITDDLDPASGPDSGGAVWGSSHRNHRLLQNQ
jgi:hypothetical protein